MFVSAAAGDQRDAPTEMNLLPELERRPPVQRNLWVKALGFVLLLSSVGLVSCQSLFAL
jgi:hypothetical protein